ncbi:hypothetical protein K431DRAFT_105541 [Polychaeton citri CBS 116435]|uniref:Uncharacterized protein n=1 Tax=Polychaeton citri CBS 116435 TaxID=1314669 RepID=A0A9P4Q899_9PEZI|nr:hypothetical protein K431DRAFT_105541 [Polychaeton citri CBS 116435]
MAEFKRKSDCWRAYTILYSPQAVSSLKGLKDTLSYAADWAKNITPDLAKCWSNGDHLKPADERRGWSVYQTIEIFRSIGDTWAEIVSFLPDTTGDASPQKIYDAYDKALEKYWRLIDEITSKGLKNADARKYLGRTFQTLLADELKSSSRLATSLSQRSHPTSIQLRRSLIHVIQRRRKRNRNTLGQGTESQRKFRNGLIERGRDWRMGWRRPKGSE